jgi:hypothetical protein
MLLYSWLKYGNITNISGTFAKLLVARCWSHGKCHIASDGMGNWLTYSSLVSLLLLSDFSKYSFDGSVFDSNN